MKREQTSVPFLVRCVEPLLWSAGVLAIAYCAYQAIEANITQARFSRLLEHAQQVRQADTALDPSPGQSSPGPTKIATTSSNNLIGRLLIPKLGLSVIVLEGDDPRTLSIGLGHIPGTSRPGQPGNIGIAGHRDTFLRPLRHIQIADPVIIETAASTYRYRVTSIEIVGPKNVSVLEAKKKDELTIVTCYPFSYIGAAPKRFVVHAEAEQ